MQNFMLKGNNFVNDPVNGRVMLDPKAFPDMDEVKYTIIRVGPFHRIEFPDDGDAIQFKFLYQDSLMPYHVIPRSEFKIEHLR